MSRLGFTTDVCTPKMDRSTALDANRPGGRAPSVIQRAQAVAGMVGDLWSHIRSVDGLRPEAAQLDVIRFQGTITNSTTITQPDSYKVPADYFFEMMGYQTFIEEPGLAVANLVLITWNAKEVGKRDVFGTDQSFGATQNILGSNPPVMFPRSLYLFSPGADIQVKFSVASGWNGGAKIAGVNLIGGLIARDQVARR